MILVVTTFEYLSSGDRWGRAIILPGWAPLLAELLGGLALVYVALVGTRDRFQYVRAQYWLVFGGLVLTIICGIVVNQVEAGPIVAGVRSYLRAIAWFLIPAVFAFSERQVRTQLRLLAVIAVMQLPLAAEQRIKTDWGATGDFTVGTMMISSILSIFLICCTCIAAALFVRRFLKPWQFVLLFFLLLIPTTINETKGTLFLLPIGLLAAFVTASRSAQRARYVLAGVAFLAVFGAVFVPVYNEMVSIRKYGTDIEDFLGDPNRIKGYLWHQQDVGTSAQAVGRMDAIVVPLSRLSEDPAHLVFGYGIGNATRSSLGHSFTGEYNGLFNPFLTSAFSRLVLELGLLGVGLILMLMWLIYRDAKAVANRDDNLTGAIAAGWVAVTIVMTISIFYKEIVAHASLSYLCWYFSGLVAAARMRGQPAQAAARLEPSPGLRAAPT
jgi:hypothetical protein